MNQEKAPHTGLRVTTILVSMVVGIVAIILCCLTVLFMNRYRDSVLQGDVYKRQSCTWACHSTWWYPPGPPCNVLFPSFFERV